MVYAALSNQKKNSISTTTTGDITAAATTIPVAELACFYDDAAALITQGISLGYDSAVETRTEEITITGASGTSGAGNLTGATRGVKSDGTIGVGYAWPSGTRARVSITKGIFDRIRDNIAALYAGGIPTINLTGGQITFPAAQSASAGANVLDDYEEGPWTPGVSFGGGTTGITYTVQSGYYEKIGCLVHVSGYIQMSSKGSSVGVALLTGLPFTSPAGQAGMSAVSLRLNKITFANQYQGYIGTSSTVINLEEITEAGVMTALADTDFVNDSRLVVSATYRVD
jgi:hypothetical protein